MSDTKDKLDDINKIDVLAMSDEEVSNLTDGQIEQLISETDNEDNENNETETEQEVVDVENTEEEEVTDDYNYDDDEEESIEEPESVSNIGFKDSDTDTIPEEENVTEEQIEASEKDIKEDTIENTQDSDKIDYKQIYDTIFAPFKANGREIKVDSVDDVISLMQMGANYNKKMAGIKPYLGIIKTLEKHEITSEKDISYLIDLKNQNPAAIAKLVKDSEWDEYEVEEEDIDNYSPQAQAVTSEQVELEETLKELEESPYYTKLVTIVGSQWDNNSMTHIAQNPGILKLLEMQMSQGIFDIVWDEVQKQRTFGRLMDLPDFEAYKQAGDIAHEQGKLNHLLENKQVQGSSERPKDEKRVSKKKAAASTVKKGKTATNPNAINPLSLSDEEFMKLGDERLM